MLVVDGYLMKMGRKPIDVKFCEKCGKSPEDFSSRKTFLKHLKNNDHMSNEAFECGQCEKSFKSKNGLGAHRQRYHKEILINCKYCQEEFTRKDALKRHVEKQHETTNFGLSCRKCKGNFKNAEPSNFKKHLINCQGKIFLNFRCTICKKRI